MTLSLLAVLSGLVIGAVVGATVLLTNFCALGAVADIVFAKDWRRLRAWLLAAAIALLGAQALDTLGTIDLDSSYYLGSKTFWLTALVGGLSFGFGMTLAGGCADRALTRIGAGSLKSLVTVLVIALTAAMTTSGVLSPIAGLIDHVGAIETSFPAGLHWMLAISTGANPEIARWLLTASISGILMVICLADGWFRRSRAHVAAGLLVGLAIVAAWGAAGTLTHAAGGAGAEAINFVTPLGELAVALTSLAVPALFSTSVVIGVPVGAFIAGLVTRNLSFEGFTEPGDLARHLVGGALMGFGGALALGCTFGQGLSGFSALSLGAFPAIAGMWFGCLWGIRYFEAGGVWRGLMMTLKRRMN